MHLDADARHEGALPSARLARLARDATDHEPLPADTTTVLEFLADCPAAASTRRRRVIAIDHHHTAAGHPPPGDDPGVRDALGRPLTELPPITQGTLARVDAALRMLPSRGWTGGLFGRRDRCLLVLSQLARVRHRHLAGLVAGDITVIDGVATVTPASQTRAVVAVDSLQPKASTTVRCSGSCPKVTTRTSGGVVLRARR